MKTLNSLFKAQHSYMELCSQSYKAGVYTDVSHFSAPTVYAAKLKAKENEAKEVILALEDELHEVLGELNWKPWKTSRKEVDFDKLGGEIADCWHFLLELTMLFNLEKKLPELMQKSFDKNHGRLKTGY